MSMERAGEPGADLGPVNHQEGLRGGGVSEVREPSRGTAIRLTLTGLVW